MQQPAPQPAAAPTQQRPPLLSAAQRELAQLLDQRLDYVEAENLYADFGFAHPVPVHTLDDETVLRMLRNIHERLNYGDVPMPEDALDENELDGEEGLI